jgi:hypothetical protein
MKKPLLMMVPVALALSGCGRVAEQLAGDMAKQMDSVTVVITGGHKFLIDGAPMVAMGHDECPTASAAMSAFSGQSGGSFDCIVLDHQRDSVWVSLYSKEGVRQETWRIVRGEVDKHGVKFPTTGLQRPDGSAVVMLQNS